MLQVSEHPWGMNHSLLTYFLMWWWRWNTLSCCTRSIKQIIKPSVATMTCGWGKIIIYLYNCQNKKRLFKTNQLGCIYFISICNFKNQYKHFQCITLIHDLLFFCFSQCLLYPVNLVQWHVTIISTGKSNLCTVYTKKCAHCKFIKKGQIRISYSARHLKRGL